MTTDEMATDETTTDQTTSTRDRTARRSQRGTGDASAVGLLRILPASDGVPTAGRRLTEMPADELAPRAARRLTRQALADAALAPEDLDAVQLVVSELVTNVVRHGGPRLQLEILPTPTGVRVEVTDHGGGLVQRRPVQETSPSGRGLAIVERLAHAWGVAERLDTKTVWCEVRTAPGSTSASPGPAARHAERAG